MENEEINDKISELKRQRKEFSREAQNFKEDIDREVRNLKELLNDDDDIRVGDYVETTEKYKRELSTQKPYSGIVVKIIDRCDADKLIVTKCLNGKRISSDISWLQKNKRVNPIYRAMFNIVADKKKIENEIKLFDVVKSNYKWSNNFTGIVIKIDDNNLVTVKCMSGIERSAHIGYLEKCE